MAQGHLSMDEFFQRLAELFDSRQKADHGSVFLVQKRLTENKTNPQQQGSNNQREYAFADLQPASPLPVLIRASNGDSKDKSKSKIKISTIVPPQELEKFYSRYGEVCKTGMQGLKKRDRSGRKKATKAKKRKEQDGEKKA